MQRLFNYDLHIEMSLLHLNISSFKKFLFIRITCKQTLLETKLDVNVCSETWEILCSDFFKLDVYKSYYNKISSKRADGTFIFMTKLNRKNIYKSKLIFISDFDDNLKDNFKVDKC